MDLYLVLCRTGFSHRVTKEDPMKWFHTKFDGIILNSKK